MEHCFIYGTLIHNYIMFKNRKSIPLADMSIILMPKKKLEELVKQEFIDLSIDNRVRYSIMNRYLKIVEDNDQVEENNKSGAENRFKLIYHHCLRVGLLNSKVTQTLNKDAALSLRAGVLHDIGKTTIPDQTVYDMKDFDSEKMKKMQYHVGNGFNMIHAAFPIEAAVMLYHHSFQRNSYPPEENIKELFSSISFPNVVARYFAVRKAREYGLYLALADFYDAMITRINDKFKSDVGADEGMIRPEDSKNFMLEEFPQHNKFINRLYDDGVFGTDYTKVLGLQEELQEE